MIVFGASLEKLEGDLAVDSIVTVRGRVDQKEDGRTTVVAQSVEPFRPDAEEVARAQVAALERRPRPLHVRVGEAARSPTVIEDLRHVLGTFPGPSEVVLELSDERRLRLGDAFRVDPSASLRAELEHLSAEPCGSPLRSGAQPTPRRRRARGTTSPATSATSCAVGPERSGPGVSRTHGNDSKRGSFTYARAPSRPSSPSPMFAWRSRLDPSGVCESLRCSEPDPARSPRPPRSRRSPRAGPPGSGCP